MRSTAARDDLAMRSIARRTRGSFVTCDRRQGNGFHNKIRPMRFMMRGLIVEANMSLALALNMCDYGIGRRYRLTLD
jgi:hypothetical protein